MELSEELWAKSTFLNLCMCYVRMFAISVFFIVFRRFFLNGFYRYVIAPYNEYPLLLGLLLKLLNGELVWSTRREVLKVVALELYM